MRSNNYRHGFIQNFLGRFDKKRTALCQNPRYAIRKIVSQFFIPWLKLTIRPILPTECNQASPGCGIYRVNIGKILITCYLLIVLPGRLCCTKPLMSEVPLSPDGFSPRPL